MKKSTAPALARANERVRRSAGSTTGARWRDERTQNAPSSTTAATISAIVRVSPQPQSDDFTIPNDSDPMAAVSNAAPPRSGRGVPAGSRVSRRMRTADTSTTMPIGTFTRNTSCHPACTSSPPIGGPAAAATPPTAAQIATAVRRSAGGNSGSSSASEVGKSDAAPTACSTARPRAARRTAPPRRAPTPP